MPQDSSATGKQTENDVTNGDVCHGMEAIFDQIAAGLYCLASMLVGEGEEGVQLVESALANAEVSVCCDPEEARRSSRQVLAKAAVRTLAERDSSALAAPSGSASTASCIDEDDLEIARQAGEELERMIGGPDRDRVRKWLAGLPTGLRTVFVLRAVAGLTAIETAQLLIEQGGAEAAGWTENAVSEIFRQGLCSLASQLIQATATS